ncbi:MAG: WD40 repeat domain-containing protein [Candidatus Thermoplasmatota archaeon]|nr:WD40 repeat domain-containing protein [Candidatus Thermoplasmatota archaeon]
MSSLFARVCQAAIFFLVLANLSAFSVGIPVEIEPTRIEVLWSYTKEDSEATFWKLDWSPDGKLIAATFFDDKCVVLNSANGSIEKVLDLSVPGTRCDGFAPEGLKPLRACCFSPDGKLLAVGGDGLVVVVFDTGTWDRKYELTGHTGSILALDYSPDSRYLASGSGTDKVIPQNAGENQTRIWDMETGRQVKVLGGHRDGVLAVKWSNSGDRLATGSDDRTLRVWDMPSGTELLNTSGHTSGILDVDWTPDDQLIVTGARDYKIKIWNATTGELRSTWSDHNCVRSVDVHPTGTYIATSGVDLTLKIRDSGTGTELKVVKDGVEQHAMVMSSRWSPDGRSIASGFGLSHTVMVYGFGSESAPGGSLPAGTLTWIIMSVMSIVFVGLLFYPLSKMIKGRRP